MTPFAEAGRGRFLVAREFALAIGNASWKTRMKYKNEIQV